MFSSYLSIDASGIELVARPGALFPRSPRVCEWGSRGVLDTMANPPPILKVPTLIGWDFFARSPSENRNDVARVHSTAARFPARFPQIPLFVISRDASARDPTLFIFNDLQAAGSISNLVGRWGIGKGLVRYARIHAGCLRPFPHAPESPRSPKLLQFQ